MLRNLLKSFLVLTAVFALAAQADADTTQNSLSKLSVSDDIDGLDNSAFDISNLVKDLKPMKGEKDEYVRLNGKIPAECKDKIALTISCNPTENKVTYTVEETAKDGFSCLKQNKEKCAIDNAKSASIKAKDSQVCISFEEIAKNKSKDTAFTTRVDAKSTDLQCQKIKIEAVKVGVLKKDFSGRAQPKVEATVCAECEERKDKQIAKLQSKIEEMQEKLDKQEKMNSKKPTGDRLARGGDRDADKDPNEKTNSPEDASDRPSRGGLNGGSQVKNTTDYSSSIATLLAAYMQAMQSRSAATGNYVTLNPYASTNSNMYTNPYATTQQQQFNPYAQTSAYTNPYATSQYTNPYAATQQQQYNPYAQTSAYTNPYAATSTYTNPYATSNYGSYVGSGFASTNYGTSSYLNPYAYSSSSNLYSNYNRGTTYPYSALGTSTGTYASNYVGSGFSTLSGLSSSNLYSTQAYSLGTRGR